MNRLNIPISRTDSCLDLKNTGITGFQHEVSHKTDMHGMTDGQYAILSLAGSQNLCQTKSTCNCGLCNLYLGYTLYLFEKGHRIGFAAVCELIGFGLDFWLRSKANVMPNQNYLTPVPFFSWHSCIPGVLFICSKLLTVSGLYVLWCRSGRTKLMPKPVDGTRIISHKSDWRTLFLTSVPKLVTR